MRIAEFLREDLVFPDLAATDKAGVLGEMRRVLRPGGRLVAFGASSVLSGERRNLLTALRTVARMPRFNMIKQMSESKTVIGLNMLTLWKERGTLEPWIRPLRELLADGTVKPVVAGAFSFDDAGAAHTMISERRNVGKVVLVP